MKGGHVVHKQEALAAATLKLAMRTVTWPDAQWALQSSGVVWLPRGDKEVLVQKRRWPPVTCPRGSLHEPAGMAVRPSQENLTQGLCDPRHSFWPFSKLFLLGHLEKLRKWNLLIPWESAGHTAPKQALSLSQLLGPSSLLAFLPRKPSSLKALHWTWPRAWPSPQLDCNTGPPGRNYTLFGTRWECNIYWIHQYFPVKTYRIISSDK